MKNIKTYEFFNIFNKKDDFDIKYKELLDTQIRLGKAIVNLSKSVNPKEKLKIKIDNDTVKLSAYDNDNVLIIEGESAYIQPIIIISGLIYWYLDSKFKKNLRMIFNKYKEDDTEQEYTLDIFRIKKENVEIIIDNLEEEYKFFEDVGKFNI